MFTNSIILSNGTTIDPYHKPYIVAEVGLNHNNDIEIGKRTIEAAKKAGANAVKFQSYITESFIDKKNAECKFLFDIFKQYELDEASHRVFQNTANQLGLDFFSTPLCVQSVELLQSLHVPIMKVASGDITNSQLLESVAKTGIPIFLSSGAASLDEVVRATDFLETLSVTNVCLFHCVSMYPTPIEKVNLKTIELYKSMYHIPIGFSDHSSGFLASSLAISLDACAIEKHFTLDKKLPGPDHTISMDPTEFQTMVDMCNQSFLAKGSLSKKPHTEETSGRFFGRRSLYADDKGKPVALRPAMHIKDRSVMDAWMYMSVKDSQFS